jgi:6-phosphogluconolactonase
MNERGVVRISPDAAQLMSTAADFFIDVTGKAIATRGFAHVALSGGSTPRALYTLLASPDYASRVAWDKLIIWFGDERTVGPNDPLSNYHMAYEALLSHVPILATNVHRIHGEEDPAIAAQCYEEELRAAFGSDALPRMDLIWLGLGPDGHTASLFPCTPALQVADRLVVANPVPQQNTTRITLTYPTINAAAIVAFLVSGDDKAAMLARVLESEQANPEDLLPSQRVAPDDGQLLWLLDLAAAGQLHM